MSISCGVGVASSNLCPKSFHFFFNVLELLLDRSDLKTLDISNKLFREVDLWSQPE